MSAYSVLSNPFMDEGFISHGPWGGSGKPGEDWIYKPKGPIQTIRLVYGKVISCIIFERYTGGMAFGFGSNSAGSQHATISIDQPNEYLTSISGTIGSFDGCVVVMSLCFNTNRTRHGPYGSSATGTPFSYEGKEGSSNMVVGFHGRAGKYVNAIGIYTNTRMTTRSLAPRDAGPWGASGGTQWDDGIFSGVKQVCVYVAECSNIIYGIKFGYITNAGQFISSQIHGRGNYGDIIKEVCLDIGMDEYLTGISGVYGPLKGYMGCEGIASITFHTNKKKLGPYGDQGRGAGYVSFTSTSSPGRIGGFHGRSTAYYLTAIGVHMQYFLNAKEEEA